MYFQLLKILNVKPSESTIVRKLFTIQFFLGVATAFLFTSSLTMFLSNYEIKILPVAYILSACLLFVFNKIYAYLDERMTSPRLLGVVTLFSAVSILLFWILLAFFPFKQLPLLIAGWYMLIYMLIGYAFWGLASVLFNVRESKRLFSIVGAGDIPAKMLGYFSVTALVPFIGVHNLLWVSITSFIVAYFLLKKFAKEGLLSEDDPNVPQHSHDKEEQSFSAGLISKYFNNRLVFFIAILSILSYVVFAFIDFTFLSDIKLKFVHGEKIATFIAIFFATGRLFAIAIKVFFSSRMISNIGLSNSLLVTPIVLLAGSGVIIFYQESPHTHLYLFGAMVLLSEILRSTLQEPVFFILFQPLKPHDRLRGHLVAKGHTMPVALIAVGSFLVYYLEKNAQISIPLVVQLLVALLLAWIGAIFLIKKEYVQTLVTSLKKGYFAGSELFLNDDDVTNILIKKTETGKPLEVIHTLNLLERSGYADIYELLLKKLQSPVSEIKSYVLTRVIENNMTSALPLIKQQLHTTIDESLKPKLLQAFFFLDNSPLPHQQAEIASFNPELKKAALLGLLLKHDEATEQMVLGELIEMANSREVAEKIMVIDIMMDSQCYHFTEILSILLADPEPKVYKRAIEVTGKAKDFTLFSKLINVVITKNAYPDFRKAAYHYGDEIFDNKYWENITVPSKLLAYIIKTTGTIKGEKSTAFLINLLNGKSHPTDEIIHALWLKKAKITTEAIPLINQHIELKTNGSKHKATYFLELSQSKSFAILRDAIFMEIKHDLYVLLKAFALITESEKVDRVIELLQAGNTEKISNAIEILEFIIPKKYFSQLSNMYELIYDVEHHKNLLTKNTHLPINALIEEVLSNNKANFSEWTRSVACFTVPKLNKNNFSLDLLQTKESKDEILFNETRAHVLSMLK